MNERSILAQTKKLSDIASFACGEPIATSIEMDAKVYRSKYVPKGETSVKYRVWFGTWRVHDEAVTFEGTWKEVLSLVDWLQDIEAPVKFSSR